MRAVLFVLFAGLANGMLAAAMVLPRPVRLMPYVGLNVLPSGVNRPLRLAEQVSGIGEQ